jgi:type IX secretion system PorP/SprF family membrane protein
MKKLMYTGILIALVNVPTSLLHAQDARIAQSYSNPLQVNPAIMGANRDIKFGLNYRSQWASIGGGYKTFSFTGMYPIIFEKGNNKFDIGINAMDDEASAYSTLNLGLALGYSKELSPNNNICLSFMGAYVQKSVDLKSQTFDEQFVNGSFNASNPNNEQLLNNKVANSDLGFGLMWFYNPTHATSRLNAYAGLAGFHLNQPNQSLVGGTAKLPMRFSYQAGVKIFGDHKLDVSPNLRVNTQNGNVETAAGLYIDYNVNAEFKLVAGGWYRAHDAIAVFVGFNHRNFSFGYSYDLINSTLNDSGTGVKANELTLCIKINRSKNDKIAVDDQGKEAETTDAYCSPISDF